jgi:hypothetical protein
MVSSREKGDDGSRCSQLWGRGQILHVKRSRLTTGSGRRRFTPPLYRGVRRLPVTRRAFGKSNQTEVPRFPKLKTNTQTIDNYLTTWSSDKKTNRSTPPAHIIEEATFVRRFDR